METQLRDECYQFRVLHDQFYARRRWRNAASQKNPTNSLKRDSLDLSPNWEQDMRSNLVMKLGNFMADSYHFEMEKIYHQALTLYPIIYNRCIEAEKRGINWRIIFRDCLGDIAYLHIERIQGDIRDHVLHQALRTQIDYFPVT